MDITKELQKIEAAGKPILTLVEEFVPDVAAIVGGGGMTALFGLVTDLVTHIGDIRNAVNGVSTALMITHGPTDVSVQHISSPGADPVPGMPPPKPAPNPATQDAVPTQTRAQRIAELERLLNDPASAPAAEGG